MHMFILDYSVNSSLCLSFYEFLKIISAIIGTKGRNLFVGRCAVNEYHAHREMQVQKV